MKLEVGMKIYTTERFGSRLYRHTITRVTDKQAIIEVEGVTKRFDREVGDGSYFREKGSRRGDRWNTPSSYSIETPAICAKYIRQCLEDKFSKIKVAELTNEQLIEILQVFAAKEESDNAENKG